MPADAPTAAPATSSLAVSMPASSRTPRGDTRPRTRGAILGGLVARSATLKTGPITATAVLWSAALAQVTREQPQLAYKLPLTLARNLPSHLRDTTDGLRELER